MTFKQKIETSILYFTGIDNPKYTKNEKNLYCDFIELISVFSNEDGTSIGDVQDRFFGTKDYNSIGQRDVDENWLFEVFLIIEERANLFGSDYPFNFNNGNNLILKENLTWRNKLYLAMLVSSKLNIFKHLRSDLTTEFETISYNVLVNFLPLNSKVKEFGKNSSYKGNAITKIRDLANDMGFKVEEDEIEGVSERNNQERGLDIIGWIPFDDKCMNQLVYLAQCACGKDTESKHHDTRRFQNYLKFYKTKAQHILFIPYSLINPNKNKFYHSDLIEQDFLIFERKRILNLFHQEDVFNGLVTCDIVNELIKAEMDIV